MADEKKKNETTEETPEVEETVVETPAAEAEPEASAADATAPEADADAAAAPEAEAGTAEAGTAEAGTAEAETAAEPEAEETPAEAPAAEAETADEPAAAPAKKQRSRKHVPRSARRTRTKTVREKAATRKPITRTEKPEGERGRRQERRGVVISDKGEKTIVVKVDVIKSHPKYKKVVRSTVKFHAHDEANTAGVGDTVRIVETRPLSKTKRWRLAEIVEKAR
jgi:small subunit ribosomal protein S17